MVAGWFVFLVKMRKLVKALVPYIDDGRKERIKKMNELFPGGHIKISGNQWLRSAFHRSDLKKVPRESTIRLAIYKIVRKKDLRFELSYSAIFSEWIREW